MTKSHPSGPLGFGILPDDGLFGLGKRRPQVGEAKLLARAKRLAKDKTLRELRIAQTQNHAAIQRYARGGFDMLLRDAQDLDRVLMTAIMLRHDAHPDEPDASW